MFTFLTHSLVAVGFFFGTMSILEGKGISGAQERISAVSLLLLQTKSCLTCVTGVHSDVNS